MHKILATTRQRVLYEARELWGKGFVTYDSETTGLEWEDQIIQWAVCSQEGEVLGSGYVRPTVKISDDAFEKHGLRIEQLADAPSFAQAWPTIRDLLVSRTVVIYNANFDIGRILSSGQAHGIEILYDFVDDVCAMHLFARFYGKVHDYYGTYIWQKLNEVAIPYLKIDVPGQGHDAVHDAAATALIIKKLAELAEQELPPGWHPPVNVPCAGCGRGIRECAEANEIWHCQSCSLEMGLFHRCLGCNHIVEFPVSSFACDDLCDYCQKRLYQEKMLLIGAWHYCPDSSYHIVETPDLEEPCEHCARQREWKRRAEEAERARQEKIERERKERRRTYAKEYRKLRKEREQENRLRAEMGLPPLEAQKTQFVEEIFAYQGHQFQRRKDQYGRPEVYCFKCDAVWSKPPRCSCAEVKTYRDWSAIPPYLKTRTQLLKLKLHPAKGQKAAAVVDGSFDRYLLYDQQACVPMEQKNKRVVSLD